MADLFTVYEHCLKLPRSVCGGRPVDVVAFWKGIEDFARFPQKYIEGLESCEILKETKIGSRWCLIRKLDYGSFSFKDKVFLSDKREYLNQVETLPGCPASFFSIRLACNEQIEVQFCYRETFTEGVSNNQQVLGIRRQAWETKDKNLIKSIVNRFL